MTNEERDKRIIEIHTAVTLLVDQVSRHDKSLYGNGQLGLCDRVKEVEDGCNNCKDGRSSLIALIVAGCALIGTMWKILG